jgi:hypothetical protein
MKDKAETMRQAEALVRQVLARRPGRKVDDNTIRMVAQKVTRAVPPYPDKQKGAVPRPLIASISPC